VTITAAADGSALGNPGPAGWGWYVDESRWAAGGWPHGTNNQGELTAVLDLLTQTAHLSDDLVIYCDSQYVINSVTKWMAGWKRRGWRKSDGKPVLNAAIMQALDARMTEFAAQGRRVEFRWVRGHAGHELNEAADRLANGAASAYARGVIPDGGPGIAGGRRVQHALAAKPNRNDTSAGVEPGPRDPSYPDALF
jgi:ribonuclease HI